MNIFERTTTMWKEINGCYLVYYNGSEFLLSNIDSKIWDCIDGLREVDEIKTLLFKSYDGKYEMNYLSTIVDKSLNAMQIEGLVIDRKTNSELMGWY